jgi:hypothetical protein
VAAHPIAAFAFLVQVAKDYNKNGAKQYNTNSLAVLNDEVAIGR